MGYKWVYIHMGYKSSLLVLNVIRTPQEYIFLQSRHLTPASLFWFLSRIHFAKAGLCSGNMNHAFNCQLIVVIGVLEWLDQLTLIQRILTFIPVA